jgi:hypothetical protein
MAANIQSWKTEPFGNVEPIPYEARYTEAEFAKLRLGLIPEQMEDKWFIYFDDPFLAFHRSWTGQPVYRIKLETAGEEAVVIEAVCAEDVLAKSDRVYQAKLLDFIVSNLLLGQKKPFPVPAGVSQKVPGLYQHAMVGRGYPEMVVARRPWWKFWR